MRIRMNMATKDVRHPTSRRGVTWSHVSLLSHQVLRTEAQRRKASSPSAKSTKSSTFGKCQCEGPPCPSMRTFRDWTKVTTKIQGPSVDILPVWRHQQEPGKHAFNCAIATLLSFLATLKRYFNKCRAAQFLAKFPKKNQSQSDSFRSQIKVKGCKGQNCFMISHHFLLTSRVPCWALPTSTLRRLPNNTWIESRRALSREGGTLSKCVMWYHNSIISAKITYIPSLCPKATNLTRKKPLWSDQKLVDTCQTDDQSCTGNRRFRMVFWLTIIGRRRSASDMWSFHPSSRPFHLESSAAKNSRNTDGRMALPNLGCCWAEWRGSRFSRCRPWNPKTGRRKSIDSWRLRLKLIYDFMTWMDVVCGKHVAHLPP